MICCAFCSASSTQVPIIMSQGYLQNKKTMCLWQVHSLPLQTQLISRINAVFSTERKAKNDIKGTFSCRSAAESRRVCNADLLPQLSSPPNPTQNVFKEHPLAATLLRCASLQCTSVGPCKTWPFVHDQPAARRLQPELSVACKALLTSEDAQIASLLCFYLLSSS